MHRASWGRAVSLVSASLALVCMMIFQGCAKELVTTKLDAAEHRLSQGKAPEESLRGMKPMLPPSLVARHRIALVMESMVKGDFSYATVKAVLTETRDSSFTPDYLRVEAGYLLTLVEKMEGLDKTASRAKECAKDNDELNRNLDQARKELDQARKESEGLKKEVEDLSFKLKKLEEIHIESVKRRGTQ